MSEMMQDFRDEFLRYRIIAEKALAQAPDHGLNRIPAPEANSLAMIVRHISGNLVSRFTDFLTTDGEKPWRKRDSEFEGREYTRKEVDELWQRCWTVLDRQLASLTDADLAKTVYTRGRAHTVHEALARSLAHLSHHVGQIVLLARISCEADWKWIGIPKGMSETYNQSPTMEKGPKP